MLKLTLSERVSMFIARVVICQENWNKYLRSVSMAKLFVKWEIISCYQKAKVYRVCVFIKTHEIITSIYLTIW